MEPLLHRIDIEYSLAQRYFSTAIHLFNLPSGNTTVSRIRKHLELLQDVDVDLTKSGSFTISSPSNYFITFESYVMMTQHATDLSKGSLAENFDKIEVLA